MKLISRDFVVDYLSMIKRNLIVQASKTNASDAEKVAAVSSSMKTVSRILDEITSIEYYNVKLERESDE